jgi:hypothetical protein
MSLHASGIERLMKHCRAVQMSADQISGPVLERTRRAVQSVKAGGGSEEEPVIVRMLNLVDILGLQEDELARVVVAQVISRAKQEDLLSVKLKDEHAQAVTSVLERLGKLAGASSNGSVSPGETGIRVTL